MQARKIIGVTLLEVMLVLAVGASLLYFSLRQYRSFRTATDIQLLQNNVDVIFSAMAAYFQANCAGNGIFGQPRGGPVIISVNNLIAEGYLTSTSVPSNPLVQGQTYDLQFSQEQMDVQGPEHLPIRSYTASTFVGGDERMTGYIPIWRAQVAITPPSSSTVTSSSIAAASGATCTSSSPGAGCDGTPGRYVIWYRSPSEVSFRDSKNYLARANVLMFNQMYTTTPMIILLTPSMQPNQTYHQYYRCTN